VRRLPLPDYRIDRWNTGVLFVYKELSYEHFGVDEVMLIGKDQYLILGIEGFYELVPWPSVGLHVRRVD
jgi:hypothetical protein